MTKLLDQEVSKLRRKSGHIRDCPEGRDGTKEDGENRIAYEFSHTSALLTELRCAVGPLCDALGCYETDVAALKYAAPPKGTLDVGRQPLHRDFNLECIARLREKVRRKGASKSGVNTTGPGRPPQRQLLLLPRPRRQMGLAVCSH